MTTEIPLKEYLAYGQIDQHDGGEKERSPTCTTRTVTGYRNCTHTVTLNAVSSQLNAYARIV